MIMRTIVIGDIHGCYRELDLLVSGLIEEGKYVPEELDEALELDFLKE